MPHSLTMYGNPHFLPLKSIILSNSAEVVFYATRSKIKEKIGIKCMKTVKWQILIKI